MKKTNGYLSKSGCGGFLNPPTHPEHDYSITGKDFAISLTSAVESDWLNDDTRKVAKNLLDSWKAPAIELPEIQEWILKVLGYFKGCYKVSGNSAPDCWNANKLIVDSKLNPLTNCNRHAGVNLIRKFYPAFIPTAKHFQNAYWGKKPA